MDITKAESYLYDRLEMLSDEKVLLITKLNKIQIEIEETDNMITSMAQDADSICPPVTQWLRSFMDAKFVVCDSFHGAVFSIIFNNPFIIIWNKERGMTRFNSLLETFKL